MNCVYLDIAHVLHPSVSTWRLCHGRSPWEDGHTPYENLPALEQALASWPDVRIVLSDWVPVVEGVESVKAQLGSLAARVEGTLYEDITTKVLRTVPARSSGERVIGYSENDLRRMSRAQAVSAHVDWSKPEAWVAITSEYQDWTDQQLRQHVLVTDLLEALQPARVQDRLATLLEANFGA